MSPLPSSSLLGIEHARPNSQPTRKVPKPLAHPILPSRNIIRLSFLRNPNCGQFLPHPNNHSLQLTQHITTTYQQALPVAAINMATTVYVKNVGSQTDDKEIKDFFSFW